MGGLIGVATPSKNGLQNKLHVNAYIQINNQAWFGDKVTTVKIIPYMSFFLSVPQSEGTLSAHALYFVSVDSSLNVYCKTIGASLAGELYLWKDNNYIYFRRGYGVAQAAGFINMCGLALEVANNISLPTSGIDSVTIS